MQSSTSSGIAYATSESNDWIANGSDLRKNNGVGQGPLDSMGSSNTTLGTYGYADWSSGDNNTSNNYDDGSIFSRAVPLAITLAAVEGLYLLEMLLVRLFLPEQRFMTQQNEHLLLIL